MTISGFNFIPNAVKSDFPVVEAINSILPILEEFVVNVEKAVDGTLKLIQGINGSRIKIIENVWDESLKKDGKILGYNRTLHCLIVQGIGHF